MAAETGFLIDGTIYEIPTLDSLDGDESMILFDYCSLVMEDFAPLEGESEDETNARNEKQMRHPGFWLSLMHIAYRRRHRELKDAKVKALIGSTNRMEAMSTLSNEPEDEPEIPLASTSEPDESSLNDSLENESSTEHSHASSGNGSTTDSDPLAGTLEATGVSR